MADEEPRAAAEKRAVYATAPMGQTAPTAPPGDGPAPTPSPWWLVLGSGGRVVLTIVLVVGAVGFLGGTALVATVAHHGPGRLVTIVQARVAGRQLVNTYDGLYRSGEAWSAGSAACTRQGVPPATQSHCLESVDATFASAVRAYDRKLSTFDFPSSVAARVARAHRAAADVADLLTRQADSGPDAVDASQFDAALRALHAAFADLNNALVHI